MKIEIFGSGCCSCNDLSSLVEKAVQAKSLDAQVVKVTDMMDIVKRGIMRTPALAVDGRIVCTGRVPKYEEVFNWLSGGGQ